LFCCLFYGRYLELKIGSFCGQTIDEFFIQKAIGWALRAYSYKKPEVVKAYIKNNELSNLSTREGLKAIKRNEKKDK
jgi:3-methyladenine DNA glycosylase AlkD